MDLNKDLTNGKPFSSDVHVRLSLFYGTARHIPEHFNTLFSGTEQLLNISLHVNSSCLGLWSVIYSY